MSQGVICAAEGCTNAVPERIGRGRPFIYCAPACRPTATKHHRASLEVEVDHEPTPTDERPAGRVWSVQLRRGTRTVVIATELGRPSAENLAAQISVLLEDRPQAKEITSTKI
jgi:hypothetical protein